MTTAAVIAGIGAWVPPSIVTNDMLCESVGVSDEWIQRRTGIRQRRVIAPGTATSDLAVEAGARALASAEVSAVDAVIVATATPDHPIPATAPTVAARLGLRGVAAFDVAAVCSGFVYGLATGSGLIATGVADQVLVVGADTFSTVVNPVDTTVLPLFGDGAGAVVLRRGSAAEHGALTAFDLGSDGQGAELIVTPGGGSRRPNPDPDERYFTMKGQEVFRSAAVRMAESSRLVLDRAKRSTAEVDRLVGHQANLRILRAVAAHLDIPADRLISNIDRVGNTAAASIPLALADAMADGRLEPGHVTLMTAFGGGLTWGSAVVTWPELSLVAD